MSTTKVVVDFTNYPAPGLVPIAQLIHTKMTSNAVIFDDPSISMADLGTLVELYFTRLTVRRSNATADVLAFHETRDELEEELGALGGYVNSVAKGDAMVCDKSGFPTYITGAAANLSPPAPPMNLRLKHSGVSGGLIARYKPDRAASTNEVQVCTGDPNDAAGWTQHGIFRNGKAVLSGFTPGILLWVRVRTVGLAGVMGAWSDPAQIRII